MKQIIGDMKSFPLLLTLLLIIGCASSRIVQNEKFTQTNVQNLEVGMTIIEVEAMFGKPNLVRTMQFGKETGKSWEGLVYEYNTVKDPSYKYTEKFLTNTLVFYTGTNPPKLNHWNIEYQKAEAREGK